MALKKIKRYKYVSWNACRKLLLNYLLLATFFFLSILSVYWIPRSESMKRNLATTLDIINSEGVEKRAFVDMMFFNLDNPTNKTIISKAAYQDRDHVLQSALMNYSASEEEILSGNYTSFQQNMYGRYWHGYLLFLKPAMYIMDYRGVRCLNYVLIGLLLVSTCILLYRKVNPQAAIAFLFSMLAMECYIVPLSLQLCTMFYIALGATCFVLLKNDYLNHKGIGCFFFTIGALTVFFDFLTVPILSLGLPLLAYILINKKGEDWRIVIKASFCWGVGYTSLWFSKWILVSLLTDYNMIADAMQQAFLRIGFESRSSSESGNILFERISGAFVNLPSNNTLCLILFLVIISCLIFFLMPQKKHGYKNNIAYLLIALIPIIWYLLLGNHTGIHWRFTHRALAVTIFSGLIFISNIIDWKRIRNKIKPSIPKASNPK